MLLKKPIFSSSELAELASLLTAENLPIYMVAALLNVDRMRLAKWREEQTGPPFIRLKRGVIVYPRELFAGYLKSVYRAESKPTGQANGRNRVSRILRETVN